MADPGWSDDDIANLRRAIASGVLSVEYGGPPARKQVFQSLAEMRSLLAEMVAARAAQSGIRRRFRRVKFSQGFGSDE